MKIIDINTWGRKSQYENFIKYTNPTFSLTTRLDVTDLVTYCKSKDKSFFSCFLYILSKSVNSVPEMRTRIVDGKPVSYDVVNPSYVVIRPDEVIVTCMTEYGEDFTSFYNRSRQDIALKKSSVSEGPFESHDRSDVIYISCIPWMDLVSVINPYNFNNVEQSSIPRITWGKFTKNGFGRYEMGFDISVHHALIDGYQVTKVVAEMSKMLNDVNTYLGD